jgi:predicted nucleic acid-binding protein
MLAMALLVVDASAFAALLFAEPKADEIAARLDGAELAAPQLMAYEIANVAATKLKRRLLTREGAAAVMEVFRRLDLRLHAVDATDAFETAARTGLTAYDGAYLWLAQALGAGLVTLDQRIARAAELETRR